MISVLNKIEILDVGITTTDNVYSELTIEELMRKYSFDISSSTYDSRGRTGMIEYNFSREKLMISDFYGWTSLKKIIFHDEIYRELIDLTLENKSVIRITTDEKLPYYFKNCNNINNQPTKIDTPFNCTQDTDLLRAKRSKNFDESDYVKIMNISYTYDKTGYCEIYTVSNTFNCNGVTLLSSKLDV